MQIKHDHRKHRRSHGSKGDSDERRRTHASAESYTLIHLPPRNSCCEEGHVMVISNKTGQVLYIGEEKGW